MKKIIIICLTTIFLSEGCQRKLSVGGVQGKPDVVADNVDISANPADDFFDWANGGWLKANPIPASESVWGIGKKAEEESFQRIARVCIKAAKGDMTNGTIEQKIGDLWVTGMDTASIELQGLKPIETELRQIDAINNLTDFFEIVGQMHANDMRPLFHRYVYQDRKQSEKNAFYLMQGGLTLPQRDYYFNQDDNNKAIRNAYCQYIQKLLMVLGEDEISAIRHAQSTLKIETFLAESHRRIEHWRDPYRTYNKFSLKDIEKYTPSVSWHLVFEKMGLPIDSIIVGQPEFIRQIEKGIKVFSIDEWKSYLRFWFINSLAPYLHKEVRDAHFDFFGRTIEGKKVPKDRYKFVLEAEENCLGEALGHLFVKDHFSSKVKKRYSEMFESVRMAFAENIAELDWMTADTRERSLDKLRGMKKKVGYPDKWKEFSSMIINRGSFVRNILNANKWWFGYKMTRLAKRADRDDWSITPHEYNAYYRPPNNEVVISATLLMIPGFSDEQIDDAVAYGYVGASTIGHEMTHGFDIGGRQYDVNGNLRQWWTEADSANFIERIKPLITQYDEQIVIDSLRCRGEATLDENIADLGGVVIALRAFQKTEQYKSGRKIAGYTPIQRFFMGYALAWMSHYTNESLMRKVLTDEHAPPKLRINMVLQNIPEFYEAFNVKPTNKMWRAPEKRVKIW